MRAQGSQYATLMGRGDCWGSLAPSGAAVKLLVLTVCFTLAAQAIGAAVLHAFASLAARLTGMGF